MMELIMPVYEVPIQIFRNAAVIIACFMIAIIILIVNIKSEKTRKADNYFKQQVQTVLVVFAFCVGIFFAILSIFENTLYIVDLKCENINESTIIAADIEYSYLRDYCIIDSDGNRYRFTDNSPEFNDDDDEIKIFLEENFLGHTCEVEYYQYSKIVKRITVCDGG